MSEKLNKIKQQIDDLKTKIAIEINESNRLISELKEIVQFDKLIEIPAILSSLEKEREKLLKKKSEIESKLEELLNGYSSRV